MSLMTRWAECLADLALVDDQAAHALAAHYVGVGAQGHGCGAEVLATLAELFGALHALARHLIAVGALADTASALDLDHLLAA